MGVAVARLLPLLELHNRMKKVALDVGMGRMLDLHCLLLFVFDV